MFTENKIKAQRIYEEAARFMNNAHKELQLADKNGDIYRDVKHLHVACGTAYLAVLKAMDGIFYCAIFLSQKDALPLNIISKDSLKLTEKYLLL